MVKRIRFGGLTDRCLALVIQCQPPRLIFLLSPFTIIIILLVFTVVILDPKSVQTRRPPPPRRIKRIPPRTQCQVLMRPDRGYLLMYRQFPREGGKGEDVEVDRGKSPTEDGDDFVRGGSHEGVQVRVRVHVESVGVHRFFFLCFGVSRNFAVTFECDSR